MREVVLPSVVCDFKLEPVMRTGRHVARELACVPSCNTCATRMIQKYYYNHY